MRGKLISADALNAVPKISEAAINNGADYLFNIKSNGGNKQLFKKTKEIFNTEMAQSNNQIIHAPTLTEKAHGRVDQYDICILPACLLARFQSSDATQGITDSCLLYKNKLPFSERCD